MFFLLVNSSDVEVLPNAKDIQLPESIAEEKAKETVVILIGDEDIIVQGTPVARVDEIMARPGNDIPSCAKRCCRRMIEFSVARPKTILRVGRSPSWVTRTSPIVC